MVFGKEGDDKKGKVGINLRGIRQLMKVKGVREQFMFMISKIESNSCTVTRVDEPTETIDTKHEEDR